MAHSPILHPLPMADTTNRSWHSILIRLDGGFLSDNTTHPEGLGPPVDTISNYRKIMESLEGQNDLDPGGQGQTSNRGLKYFHNLLAYGPIRSFGAIFFFLLALVTSSQHLSPEPMEDRTGQRPHLCLLSLPALGPAHQQQQSVLRKLNDPGCDVSSTQHPALLVSWNNPIKDSGLFLTDKEESLESEFLFSSCATKKMLLQTTTVIPEHTEQASFGLLLGFYWA